MDITVIAYGMLFVAVAIGVASVLMLRKQQKLHEKALIYGVIASMMVQLFSFFFVFTGDFLVVLMNGGFLAIITYNMYTIFGIRMSKIYEKDQKAFYSFFVGNAIIANALSFIMLGIASLTFGTYSTNPAFIESVGQEVVDQLAVVIQAVTVDHLGTLLVGTLSSVIVTFSALAIFVRAHQAKVGSMIGKGILVLFSFYIINLYVPQTEFHEMMQMVLYVAVAASGLAFWNQVQNQKVTPKENK